MGGCCVKATNSENNFASRKQAYTNYFILRFAYAHATIVDSGTSYVIQKFYLEQSIF